MKRSSLLTQTAASSRQGISLLEVILSTAIFLGALTAIMQIMNVGHDSRIMAKLDAEAAVRCEMIMGEYISGLRDFTAESETPFEDEEGENWSYSSTIEDGPGEGLLMLTVTVEHVVNETTANSSFELTRYVRDPEMYLDAALNSATSSDSEPAGEEY